MLGNIHLKYIDEIIRGRLLTTLIRLLWEKLQRPLWVSGGNYNANHVAGGFRGHTGPSLLILANFGSRPKPVTYTSYACFIDGDESLRASTAQAMVTTI